MVKESSLGAGVDVVDVGSQVLVIVVAAAVSIVSLGLVDMMIEKKRRGEKR